jgi:hypothetical protein
MRILFTLTILLGLMASAYADDQPRVLQGQLKLGTAKVSNSTARSLQAAEFKPVTAVRITPPLTLGRLLPIVPAEKTVDPTGPNPEATIDLGDIIDDSALLEDMALVCGWDSHLIFQDTAAAHVFYYIPRVFLLKHDRDGYRLNVQYNARAEAGQPSVMITAEMAAPHRSGDVKLLKAILRQALELNAGDPLTIKSLPGLGATADLQALSTGLMLQTERIQLTPPAHLKQVFRLTLSLTQDEAEEVLAQIARDGIVGALNVKVGASAVPIPIRIRYEQFAGGPLEGFDKWADGGDVSSIRNISYFPVSIDAINGYRLANGKLERLSKKLKSISIDPGTSKSLKLPDARTLLGENLAVTWMSAEIDGSCDACLKKIDSTVRKGVGASPGENIHLEAIPSLFDEFGVYKLIVHIQSPYLTVEGDKVRQEEVVLTADENENETLTIYIPADRGENPLLYKYRLEVVTETGEALMAKEWENSRKLTRFFGSSQVEGLFDGGGDDMPAGFEE